MKLVLKGGSVIEVSDKEYFCIINDVKVAFCLKEELRPSVWSEKCKYTFEDFIVPRSFVERVLL